MDIFAIYITIFFIVFLIMPTVYFVLRFILWLFLDYFGCGSQARRNRNRARNTARQRVDRQANNVYTISDNNNLDAGPPRFADFFYLEPGSAEAQRIRAQLEKDEKELPSYDEVMRMTILESAQTAAPMGVSTSSIATATTDVSLPPVPPYTEVDLSAVSHQQELSQPPAFVPAIAAASTSHAAAAALTVAVCAAPERTPTGTTSSSA